MALKVVQKSAAPKLTLEGFPQEDQTMNALSSGMHVVLLVHRREISAVCPGHCAPNRWSPRVCDSARWGNVS